jgi:L-cysteine:1D-myo-inositol 2-amino-2-deoxy-alpha-D-glucopyranoside ligase
MEDDLYTPAALAVLHVMAGDTLAAAAAGRDIDAAQATLRDLAGMLGFTLRG